MKKTRRKIFGILMTALMVCLPAMQAFAQSFDASVMDPVPILFPGDALEGILTPVTLDGAPLDLGAEAPATWVNEDENKVYRTDLAEDGSLILTLAGYELNVEGGTSEAGDETTGPIGGHYVNADGSVDMVEGEPTKDRAYYPAYTVVKLKADEPEEGMVFDKWTVETLSNAVAVEDETNSETTLTMPEEKVKVIANYRTADEGAEGAPAEGEIDPNMGVAPEGQDGVDMGAVPEGQDGADMGAVPEAQDGADMGAVPEGQDGVDMGAVPEVQDGADMGVVPEVQDGLNTGVAPDGTVVVDGTGADPQVQTPEVTIDPDSTNDSIWDGLDENAIDITIDDASDDLSGMTAPADTQIPVENTETRYMLSVNYGTVTVENAADMDLSQGITAGTPVTVTANDYTANGCSFGGWTVGPQNVELVLEDSTSATITFAMPAGETVLTAQYVDANGVSVSDPTVPLPTPSEPEPQPSSPEQEPEPEPSSPEPQPAPIKDPGTPASYTLTVTGGTVTAGGEAKTPPADIEEGTLVTVTAVVPEGNQFTEWVLTSPAALTMTGALTDPSFTFTMPAEPVILEAKYELLPAPVEPQKYTLTLAKGVMADGQTTFSGEANTVLNIKAEAPAAGMQFSRWIAQDTNSGAAIADSCFGNVGAMETTFTMPAANVTVTASYAAIEYTVTVNSGSANVAKAVSGTTVTLTAGKAPKGMEFDFWRIDSGNASLASAYSETTTFVMPAANVTVSANYKLKQYYVTVENGYADDDFYYKDDDVTISSDYPADGKEFDKWEVIDGKASFADSSRWKTTFTMPARDVTVSATYKNGPAPEDNQILELVAGGEYITDSTIKFTAVGAGMDNNNPNPGDYRYRPIGYQIGNVTGSWQAAPYTTSMSIKARGDYTLKVNYSKEEFDGNNWVADGTTDTRSVSFRVLTPAEAVKTGDETPIALMVTIAGVSFLLFFLLLMGFVRRRRNG